MESEAEKLKTELIAAFATPAPKRTFENAKNEPPGPWWLDLECAPEMIESVLENRRQLNRRKFRRNTPGTRKAKERLLHSA